MKQTKIVYEFMQFYKLILIHSISLVYFHNFYSIISYRLYIYLYLMCRDKKTCTMHQGHYMIFKYSVWPYIWVLTGRSKSPGSECLAAPRRSLHSSQKSSSEAAFSRRNLGTIVTKSGKISTLRSN